MKTGQKIIIIAMSLLALASVAVCLQEVMAEDNESQYQTYEYSDEVIKVERLNSGSYVYDVYLGDGNDHNSNTIKTNEVISNKTKWDTSKILRTDQYLRVCYDNLCTPSTNTLNVPIQMKMVAGSYSDTKTMVAGSTTAQTFEFEAGGLKGILKIGKPSAFHYDSINFYNPNKNGTPINLLEVTNSELFKTVPSPVVFQITVGEGDAAVTSEIQVHFDDSDHTKPDTGSEVTIDSKTENGYSVLDVSVDSDYAGTDNYLLAIAKYEGGIVYNSYLKVPSSAENAVRMAFSNEGLQEVVIEIVSNNEAFGDSVPGYLAYNTYVPS